jgi:2-oxoisovalerate dehydrogenase E1 component
MVEKVRRVVEELGIDAEIVDLRSLDRAGLDWNTIGTSVRKTHKVLQRVLGGEASPSISKVLEAAACAGPEEIAAGLRRVLAESGL